MSKRTCPTRLVAAVNMSSCILVCYWIFALLHVSLDLVSVDQITHEVHDKQFCIHACT